MRRRKDSGFAMLAVFLMAACVAITLYIEVPRVAFEAERQRELLLVDRGTQFKRAIQVFVKDRVNNPTGRYPASIDEMESFNNHRYLRRRYVDPLTGKDEWRLVHINGGVLTDSVTTQMKVGTGNQSISTASTYLTQQAYLETPAGDANTASGGATRALNRRPSDTTGTPGDPNNPGGAPGMPGNGSGLPPGLPGSNPSGMPPGLPGSPNAGQQQTSQQPPQQPCQVYIGSCPPTTTASGQQGQPAQDANGGLPPGMQPGIPGGAGFGAAGAPGSPQSNSAAANLIGNLLTTPRPGGMPSGMPGTTTGGGIAGVASKYEAEGIMVINQRTKINEWEYIFDATKWRAPPNPVTGTAGTPLQPGMNGPGINNSTPPGTAPGGGTGTGTGTGVTGPGGGVTNH